MTYSHPVGKEDFMFQVGQTVRLKTGGPDMTVDHVWINSVKVLTVRCVWFDERNERKEGSFPAAGLVAAQTEDVSAA
jgi:uncharacterized protein YodC (DUF2158 family)